MKRRGSFPAGIEKDLLALKPGEVTKLETEMSGFNIYKLRSRDTIPVESVKAEIIRDLHQKNMEAAIKAVTGSIHPELNDQFFGPTGRTGGPILRNPQSPDAGSSRCQAQPLQIPRPPTGTNTCPAKIEKPRAA